MGSENRAFDESEWLAMREQLQVERAARQSAEELTATLERMLGMVGHELRNPLGAVLLATTSLQRQELPADQAKMIGHIATSVARMRRMISQLLDLAAIRQGGLRLHRAPCDLRQITEQALQELRAAFPGCDIAVSVEGEPRGQWDPDRMIDVVANLVRNALQHGRDLCASVRLTAVDEQVTLTVTNGGNPIAAEALALIFDPFRRLMVQPEGKRRVGLGLYIVKSIVEAHGGSIDVRSHATSGTSFTVLLPG
jgi:signal transduction histidine kinase